MTIQYLIGDATSPQGKGTKIVLHCCNDIGLWGAGFVLALSKKWKEPELHYRSLKKEDLKLGTTWIVPVEVDIIVVNIIGQCGVRSKLNPRPISYQAIDIALSTISGLWKGKEVSFHMPRIGCGLAGGKWEEIEQIINKHLKQYDVFVYDLK
jgi:O-acetyl-ADP-ribose deacetylase (regulator of RNase III)